MSWLASLPHQIPFRAASDARRVDERTVEGKFLWTANELLPAEVMLVEAMAQCAGGLAFTAGHGLLTGIDRCEVTRQLEPGDLISIVVTLEASFGGTFRFGGVATIDGLECARGRFYLAAPHAET